KLPQLDEVPDALRRRLHVTIKHRRVGVDPQRVRGAVDVEPAVGADFAFEDFIVHAVVEDLCAATGERAKSCVAKGKQYLAHIHAGDAGEVDDLDGGEG